MFLNYSHFIISDVVGSFSSLDGVLEQRVVIGFAVQESTLVLELFGGLHLHLGVDVLSYLGLGFAVSIWG